MNVVKTCKDCGKEKPEGDFYFIKKANRFHSYCKECTNIRNRNAYDSKKSREYYENNKSKIDDYNRVYYKENRDKLLGLSKKYQKLNKVAFSETLAKWKKENPEAIAAYKVVKNAIAIGVLQRPCKCELCKSEGLIDCHHMDYSEPLKGLFLCRSCHRRFHREAPDVVKAVEKLNMKKWGF